MLPIGMRCEIFLKNIMKNHADDVELFAESMMNIMLGIIGFLEMSKKLTVEVIDVLETVSQCSPRHLFTSHLYIHALEASLTHECVESAADI